MIVATIAFAALLGSASVAFAFGRICVVCGASEDDYSSLGLPSLSVNVYMEKLPVIKHVMRKQKICAVENLSRHLAEPLRKQRLQGISIKDCGDDPCYFIRGEPKVPGRWNPAGGTRGCFTAELRNQAEKGMGMGMHGRPPVPSPNSPARCTNVRHKGPDAEKLETELCLDVCDKDLCNVELHRTRATRATRAARAINDASADASIEKKKSQEFRVDVD